MLSRRPAVLALLTAAVLVVPASAAPAVGLREGEVLCEIDSSRVQESSGLAVLPGGQLVTHSDSGSDARYEVLDRTCEVVSGHSLGGVDAFDWEDAAAGPGPDGEPSLWFADTGDNSGQRQQPAVVVVGLPDPDDEGQVTERGAQKFVLSFETPGLDVEALLVDPLGRGFALVSKNPFGQSQVLTPRGALTADGVTTMTSSASVALAPTGTPGGPAEGLAALGAQVAVTGGAISPAGDRLVLRTYTDALFWELDPSAATLRAALVAALEQDPVIVPLPETEQGEAITFDLDGTTVLTTTEGRPAPVHVVSVPAVAAAQVSPSANASPTPSADAVVDPGAGTALPSSGLPDVPTLALAGLGILLGAFVVTSVLTRSLWGRRAG